MAPKTRIQISARRKVADCSVLARSTDTVSDASYGVDQRIGLLAVHFTADPPDVNVDDVRSRIEMQVPHILQQERTRNHPAFVAKEIFQQLELTRQQFDFPAAPADGSRYQVHLELADA